MSPTSASSPFPAKSGKITGMWMEGLLLGTGLLPEPLLFAKWVASFSESLLFDGRIPEPNKLHPLPLCVGERRCAAATVATAATTFTTTAAAFTATATVGAAAEGIIETAALAAGSKTCARTHGSDLVVFGPLRGIRKNRVGFGDALERGLGFGIARVAVGVVLARQLPIGLLDGLIICALGNTQDVVEGLLAQLAPPSPSATTTRAGRMTLSFMR
jgi:hypothetical protein